jgi:hypothetical protein
MDPEEDGQVLLHLLEIKDVAGSPALSNPEAVKGKAFETLRQLAVKGSQGRPLALVLEDLHWVDKISEEFIGFLAENVRDAPVLLLATYRPGYRPPWIDKSYAGQTPLQPLSRDDSIQMVPSVANDPTPSPKNGVRRAMVTPGLDPIIRQAEGTGAREMDEPSQNHQAGTAGRRSPVRGKMFAISASSGDATKIWYFPFDFSDMSGYGRVYYIARCNRTDK